MSGSFNNWLSGSPLVAEGKTLGFSHWLSGTPLLVASIPSLFLDYGFLLPAPPHWRSEVNLTAKLPTARVRGLGGAEARQRFAHHPRFVMEWAASCTAEEWAVVRNLLQANQDQRYLVPAWPFMRTGADWGNAEVGGGLLVGWLSGWNDFEVGATLADATEWDWVAPILAGRLEAKATARGPGVIEARFTLTEDASGDYALDLGDSTWDAGPTLPDDTAPTVFPFPHAWASDPETGVAEIEAKRKTIGYTRTAASQFFAHAPERPLEAEVTLPTAEECARALRWFRDVGGDVSAHYVSTLAGAGTLAANVAAGASALTVEDAAAIGGNRFLALEAFGIREFVRATSVNAGTGAVTLSAPLARSWDAEDTHVSLAMLARLARPQVRLSFRSPDVAEARFQWREVPAEVEPDAGETRGSTIGALPAVAYLYKFTFDRAGAEDVLRLTSYETALTAGAVEWTPHEIEHGETRRNARMDRDDMSLSLRQHTDLSTLFLPGRHDARLVLSVSRCTVNPDAGTGSSVAEIYAGECTKADLDGPFMRLSFAGASAMFARKCPRLLMQPGCNHAVYGVGCGLDVGDWAFSGTVYSVSGNTVILEDFAYPGGVFPDSWGGADYWALGYVQTTTKRRFVVASSTAKDFAGRVVFTLVSPPSVVIEVGDTLVAVPGCDGRPETCKAYHATNNPGGKFDNFDRFLGFPRVPAKNPSFSPLKRSDSSNGKK